MEAILTGAMVLLALHVAVILYRDGYAYRFVGPKGGEVAPPVILLLVLAILRSCLKRQKAGRRGELRREAFLLFAAVLIVYLVNGRTLWSGDTLPARYLPLSILRQGNFDLDEFPSLYARGIPYELRLVRGHYVSAYPVGAALLALPFYVVPAIGRVGPDGPVLPQLEKLSAAAITALSAMVLYLVLRRLTGRRLSVLLAAVYALGTSSFSVSSQALWQHGPSQLALTVTLYCLVRGRGEPRWVAFAGFPLAFAVICRPSDVLIAAPVGIYVLVHHYRQVGWFLLSGLPPALFQLWYNTRYFDEPLRSQFSLWEFVSARSALWEGLGGILASPGRGLFVYSPVFLFSVVGMGLAWRRKGEPLLRYLSVGVLLTILLSSKWPEWWGGHTYGPRLLADLSPILALSLYRFTDFLAGTRARIGTFLLVALWSVSAHFIGAFSHPYWNTSVGVDGFRRHVFWFWTDNQLVNPPRRLLSRALIAWRGLPTNRTAPTFVWASYEVQCPPIASTVRSTAFQLSLLSVVARNTGRGVWLGGIEEAGVVTLGWRWLKGAEGVPRMSGWTPLRYDVFPGKSHEFWVPVDAPEEPGFYALEVSLFLDDGKLWLWEAGVVPLRFSVSVTRDEVRLSCAKPNSADAAERPL